MWIRKKKKNVYNLLASLPRPYTIKYFVVLLYDLFKVLYTCAFIVVYAYVKKYTRMFLLQLKLKTNLSVIFQNIK